MGAFLAAASAAQCEQHKSGAIEASLSAADYPSSFLPVEEQQFALFIITVTLFGIFPHEIPER